MLLFLFGNPLIKRVQVHENAYLSISLSWLFHCLIVSEFSESYSPAHVPISTAKHDYLLIGKITKFYGK